MNKTERLMLLEIYNHSSIVPNFKNNMDMQGYSTFRHDSIEVSMYIKELSYSMLMFATPEEDKAHWREMFYEELNNLKQFVDTRKKEDWGGNSRAIYRTAVSGW